MIKVEGETYYPEAISAKLLAAFKEEAEAYIGGLPIADAVITVPAYFNNAQRHATKEAGKLAGLNVLQILDEPIAAAITYSLHRSEPAEKNVLVFDLGGGTFDVSVLTIENGFIKILAVGGDTHLGGEDFDSAMVIYCIEQFKNKHGIDLSEGKNSEDKNIKYKTCKRLRRIRSACEKAKEQLSFVPMTEITRDSIYGDKQLNIPMTRKILEDLIQNILTKYISTVDAVLSKIPSLTKKDIDEIVLVGGETRIAKIKQMLVEYFDGKRLSKTTHPDEAVAHGAAVLACLLSQGPGQLENLIKISDAIPTLVLVSPEDLGLEAEFPRIVEKLTTVPCTLAKDYQTKKDNEMPNILNHAYEPLSIEYMQRILTEHFSKKLEEDLTLRKPRRLLETPAGTEPVPNYALVLKQELSHSRLEEFLRPIIRDIYESTQSEPFSLELYSKGVISRSQKETCMGKPSNADRNDYLYGIVFVRNAVDNCIDALDNIENRHILEKMVQRLSVKLK